VEVKFLTFLAWALDGDEWLASHFYHSIPRERTTSINWTRWCVGPVDGLYVIVMRKGILKIHSYLIEIYPKIHLYIYVW
jgi:hypothetical protein